MPITRPIILGLCLAIAPFTFAEENPRAAAKVAVKSKDKAVDKALNKSVEDPRIWVATDYVGLWSSKAPQPKFPLLTLGNDNLGTLTPGALGDPATSIFYQPKAHEFGVHHGLILTAGGWITEDRKWGAEASLLWTPKQSDHQTILAPLDVSGLTTYRPFFEQNPDSPFIGQQNSFVLGGLNPINFARFGPGTYPGGLTVKNEEQYWTTNVHGLYNVVRDKHWSASALLGFSYHSLAERYQIDYFGFTPDGVPGTSLSTDKFMTSNKFYGADLGMKFEFKINRFTAEVTPKVALGATNEELTLSGVNTSDYVGNVLTGGSAGIFRTTPDGFWISSTNAGTRSRSVFTVLPSLEAKVGVRINKFLDFNVGYTGMYWNHTVHPGNQLDYQLNGDHSNLLTLNSIDGLPHFQGNPYPVSKFKDSYYWAQGVTAGFKVKF